MSVAPFNSFTNRIAYFFLFHFAEAELSDGIRDMSDTMYHACTLEHTVPCYTIIYVVERRSKYCIIVIIISYTSIRSCFKNI